MRLRALTENTAQKKNYKKKGYYSKLGVRKKSTSVTQKSQNYYLRIGGCGCFITRGSCGLNGRIPCSFNLLIYLMQTNGKLFSLNYIICYKFKLFIHIDCNNTDNKQVLCELSRIGHHT